MGESDWLSYRLGAKIPSLDHLIGPNAKEQAERLQSALSSVACRKTSPPSVPNDPPSQDAVFIGRLLLGLLCRGWPTHSSPAVEDALLAVIDPSSGLTHVPADNDQSLGWKLSSNHPVGSDSDWGEIILDAMLKADLRLVMDESEVSLRTDSSAELRFYREQLTPLLGNAIGWLELQRPIESMVDGDPLRPDQVGSGRVDFSLELPRPGKPLRISIELDGPHHSRQDQRRIDVIRDRKLQSNDWEVCRISLPEWASGDTQRLPERLAVIIEKNSFPFARISNDGEWFSSARHREMSRLILTPHAVARIQLGLTLSLIDGTLSFASENWVIAVSEREVPCAELAVRDWVRTLEHLCRLYNVPMRTQHIRLLITEDHLTDFSSPMWKELGGNQPRVSVSTLRPNTDVPRIDLAIDVSVGAHPTRRYSTDPLGQPHLTIGSKIVLRTAQRQSGYRIDSWPEEPRIIGSPRQHVGSLRYFLQYLFRKRDFRPGQVPIIERALRRQDVIGLLPTGAGKSITFQLPALLSPGLSLVIDPLKSLMQDQVENLRTAGIMDAIQINSDTTAKDRSKIERQFSGGEYRLVFISPERLQVQDFRDRLRATVSTRPVAYFVVDETHCVSEWGHDFRTAYLNLGRIAREHCSHLGGRPPIIALTGTASESVLRDAQRELEIESNDAIVRPQDFNREELKFEIARVAKSEKLGMLLRMLDREIPQKLGMTPEQLANGACGGLVFCPHANGELGVVSVADAVSRRLTQFSVPNEGPSPQPLVGYFSGEKPKHIEMTNEGWSQHKTRTQRSFKAGKTPLLVATKAFGMGIDKPNIRYTVHYSMPQSVEAFAQEAGRAGRDRKDAICTVLFTDRYAPGHQRDTALDCLETGISVEEANRRARAADRNSDDAEMMMFLHTRSYPGVERESASVRSFYHAFVEPSPPSESSGMADPLSVTLSDTEVESRLTLAHEDGVSYGSNDELLDTGLLRSGTADDQRSRHDVQRIIYRLSLLGLVDDYTIRYGFGDNVYTLWIRPLSACEVRENLLAYVRRYRTSDRIRSVEAHLEASPLEGEVCKVIDTLCWFIYEEIEQRRRQGISNMRQLLRDSTDGTDLSRRINEFLSNTALTQEIFDVLDADDPKRWASIASQITNSESAEHIFYQCRRALEDAPEHPGLVLLQALSLLAMDSSSQSEITTELRFGLLRAQQAFSPPDYAAIVEWVIDELSRLVPVTRFQVMQDVILAYPDPQLARSILRSIEAGRLPNDPLLVRTASRCLLARIDSRIVSLIES